MIYSNIAHEIKSPLRYPGGKSKALKQIFPYIPAFKEYREPFVGGGSVFLAVKQRISPEIPLKINDLNIDLYSFWKEARDHNEQLVKVIRELKEKYTEGNQLIQKMRIFPCLNDVDRAIRFFIINRITFSGLSDSGGYSQQAFEKRFTESSIQRLVSLTSILKGVEITNQSYQSWLFHPGKDVFLFLDPPYFKARKKRLYGHDGDLHLAFDHTRFAEDMHHCPHKWLITYDDCPQIRALFNFANISEWELQYGMNNYRQSEAAKGKELFITNYDINDECVNV
jgi:DNA adenine methylase